jgi:hypothetical protein
MHTDELRREVAAMADEVDGFAGDVQTLYRKRRRRRVIASVTAVAAIAGLVSVGAAVARSPHNRILQVSSAPSKEVDPSRITHIDAIVLPASDAVKLALDRSSLVDEYALVPRMQVPVPGPSLLEPKPFRSALCALRSSDGYAVTATTAGATLAEDLSKALGANAKVYAFTDQFGSWDAEIFLKVFAPADEVSALQSRLERDPDIRSFRHISANDAYDIFKKEFTDQPALVLGTKPSDLPQSFRVIVEPGRSIENLADRYKGVDGVDTVITQESRWLWHVPAGAPIAAPTACNEP